MAPPVYMRGGVCTSSQCVGFAWSTLYSLYERRLGAITPAPSTSSGFARHF